MLLFIASPARPLPIVDMECMMTSPADGRSLIHLYVSPMALGFYKHCSGYSRCLINVGYDELTQSREIKYSGNQEHYLLPISPVQPHKGIIYLLRLSLVMQTHKITYI